MRRTGYLVLHLPIQTIDPLQSKTVLGLPTNICIKIIALRSFQIKYNIHKIKDKFEKKNIFFVLFKACLNSSFFSIHFGSSKERIPQSLYLKDDLEEEKIASRYWKLFFRRKITKKIYPFIIYTETFNHEILYYIQHCNCTPPVFLTINRCDKQGIP